MERFLQPGTFAVASVFAPTQYPPVPLLAFADPLAPASSRLSSENQRDPSVVSPAPSSSSFYTAGYRLLAGQEIATDGGGSLQASHTPGTQGQQQQQSLMSRAVQRVEGWQLAATGSLRGPDTDRIILKKIVLSG